MTHDGIVTIMLCQRNRIDGFSYCSDLVYFYQQSISNAFVNSFVAGGLRWLQTDHHPTNWHLLPMALVRIGPAMSSHLLPYRLQLKQ